MIFCIYCKAALEENENILCEHCIGDGNNLDIKLLMILEWRNNIQTKLNIVSKTINNVEEAINRMVR